MLFVSFHSHSCNKYIYLITFFRTFSLINSLADNLSLVFYIIERTASAVSFFNMNCCCFASRSKNKPFYCANGWIIAGSKLAEQRTLWATLCYCTICRNTETAASISTTASWTDACYGRTDPRTICKIVYITHIASAYSNILKDYAETPICHPYYYYYYYYSESLFKSTIPWIELGWFP